MTTSQMFSTLTGPERLRLLRMMRSAMHTNRLEAQARQVQPSASTGTSVIDHIESLTECANVVLGMYPDPKPLDGLVAAFDAEAGRMRATMGQQDTGTGWPGMTTIEVCSCWSCEGQCGGGCGPVTITHRGPICDACAAKAVVFDDDRTGAQVEVTQERVKLTVDVFDSYAKRGIYLDVDDVPLLVDALTRAARVLANERGRAEA